MQSPSRLRRAGKILLAAGLALLAAGAFASLVLVLSFCLRPSPKLFGEASFSTLFEDRNGQLLRLTLASDGQYRIFTPLESIPTHLKEATLLYEDRAFWWHPGVNPLALLRAMGSMALGGRRMGASTLTMQLVRLNHKLDTTTFGGKLHQMYLALELEWHYSKEEILEAYLNLAPYGSNVEGVGAAARIWFHKKPENLNIPECLTLVTVPQHPVARNPMAQQGKALSAARQRLNKLWLEQYPHQAALLMDAPLRTFSPAQLPFEAPHVTTELLNRPLPANPTAQVRTTIDLRLQKSLERTISQSVARNTTWGMKNAAALLVHWPSGEIYALAGSADFSNASIEGQVDGTLARRSPGSTLKPFIYALALENGLIHPGTILADAPRSFGSYSPENADGTFQGPLPAHTALQRSRNIPAVSLAQKLPRPGLYGFLKKAGVQFPKGEDHYGLALVLGGAEVSARELASLYAMLANRGIYQPLSLVKSQAPQPGMPSSPAATSPDSSAPMRLLSPEAAFVTLNMLAAPGPFGKVPRLTTYWKTGTSNGLRDSWTAGIFGPYALVVWVGNFDSTPNAGFTGMNAAAPLFFDIATALTSQERLPDLVRDNVSQSLNGSGPQLNLLSLPVCTATGDVNISLCSETTPTWFLPGISPIADSGILRTILIDQETGLRQCREIPGRTQKVVWEFWPSDLRQLFLQAGVLKPLPPPYAPECLSPQPENGQAPVILSPQQGLVYNVRLSSTEPSLVPLHATVDADTTELFWFADANFVGKAKPGEIIFWQAQPGVHVLRAVDNQGRAASLDIQVDSVP